QLPTRKGPELAQLCLKHILAAGAVGSPPPCGEGFGVGVVRFLRRWRHPFLHCTTPLPSPPPQGGREQTELAAGFGFYLRGRTRTEREDPSARSTTCSSGRPCWKRSTWRSTLATSARGSEAAALCGVMVTLGCRQSGLAGASGSRAKTSSVAPASEPSSSAARISASTCSAPRAALMR